VGVSGRARRRQVGSKDGNYVVTRMLLWQSRTDSVAPRLAKHSECIPLLAKRCLDPCSPSSPSALAARRPRRGLTAARGPGLKAAKASTARTRRGAPDRGVKALETHRPVATALAPAKRPKKKNPAVWKGAPKGRL